MAITKECTYCGKVFYSEHNLCQECRYDSQSNVPYEEWDSLGTKIFKVIKHNHNGLEDNK